MEPLKPKHEITKPDDRWAFINGSLDLLYSRAEAMSLNDLVPENVQIQFQQVQHLIVLSYFQYSLLSVVMLQAAVALECGLLERWRQAYPEKAKESDRTPTLTQLLKKAVEDKWFSNVNPKLLELIPIIRNDQAHGDYFLTPVDTIHLAGVYGKLIQDLFPVEDSVASKEGDGLSVTGSFNS